MQCRDIAELMMDYLYQELDPTHAREFRNHVGGCARCSADLAGFEGTRKALSKLSVMEPSQAVSARLLAEASRHAPRQAQPGGQNGGMLGWVLALGRNMAMHPALSAVATLVLVGGVAGYLTITGRDMSEPGVREEKKAPVSPVLMPEPTVAAPPTGGLPPALPDEGESARREPEKNDRTATLGKDKGGTLSRERLRGEAKQKAIGNMAGEKADGKLASPADDLRGRVAAEPPAAGPVSTRSPPAPQVADEAGPSGEAQQVVMSEKSNARDAEVEVLHKQAKKSASGGDCATVTTLKRRIQKIDPGYYESNNIGSSAELRCDPPVRPTPTPERHRNQSLKSPAPEQNDSAPGTAK